jgi:hypothetical protein
VIEALILICSFAEATHVFYPLHDTSSVSKAPRVELCKGLWLIAGSLPR